MSLGSVSDGQALLLDSVHRMRFVPNGGYAGSATLTFRAWDQTDGSAGATGDASLNGGSSAFSMDSDSALIVVMAANTAPVLDAGQTPQLTPIQEGNTSNAGNSISDVIVDGSITDADGPASQSMAITYADNSNGQWQYSMDGGATWTDLLGLSESAALLLDSHHQLRFVPDNAFFGTAQLSFVAWDKSSGNAGSQENVTSRGGITPYSADADTAFIAVKDVQHAPIFVAPTPSGSLSATEGVELSFELAGSDADNDPLSFDVSPLPAGASFDSGTRIFSWTPTYDQEGSQVLTLSVSDASATVEQAVFRACCGDR